MKRVVTLWIVGVGLMYAQFAGKVGFGFGLPTAGNALLVKTEGSTRSVVFTSLGKGLYPELGGWYYFNENVAVGLDAAYVLGLRTKVNTTIVDDNTGAMGSATNSIKGSMFQIMPGLTIRASGDFAPYASFQGIIGFGAKGINELDGTIAGITYKETAEYTGGTALGFKGALGAIYNLGGVGLFFEVAVHTLSWAPTQVTTTTEIGGISNTETTKLEKSISANQQGVELTDKAPFSAVIFRIGALIGGPQ